MAAVVYARQAKSPGGDSSLESQITRCQDYALRVGCTEVEIFTDDGYTGWTLDRPGLQAALARTQEGDVNYFIVFHLNCLARRVRDQMLLIKTLGNLGIRVAAVQTSLPHPVSLNFLQYGYQNSYKVN